jgi:hypothetical protein
MTQRPDTSSRRRTLRLVLDGIDIVLHRLEALGPSRDVDAARTSALHQLIEVQKWERSWPPLEEQERVLKRVLDLQARASSFELPRPRARR